MAYMKSDNGVITIDAKLTKKGRQLIAKGIQNFKITRFSLSDTQMDYGLEDININEYPILQPTLQGSQVFLDSKLFTSIYTDGNIITRIVCYNQNDVKIDPYVFTMLKINQTKKMTPKTDPPFHIVSQLDGTIKTMNTQLYRFKIQFSGGSNQSFRRISCKSNVTNETEDYTYGDISTMDQVVFVGNELTFSTNDNTKGSIRISITGIDSNAHQVFVYNLESNPLYPMAI